MFAPPPAEAIAAAVERARGQPPGASDLARTARTLWGLVLDCSLPRPTRGSDHVANLYILDASCPAEQMLASGIEVIVFCRDPAALPQAAAPGDIIRMQQAVVQFWGTKPQLVCKLSPNKPFGYALFSGAPGGPDAPYRTRGGHGAPTAGAAPGDGDALAALRALGSQRVVAAGGGGDGGGGVGPGSVYLRKLQDLAVPPLDEPATAQLQAQLEAADAQRRGQAAGAPAGQRFVFRRPDVVDVRCRVLAVDAGDPGEAVLFVWDSTDVRPMPGGITLPPSMFKREELRAHAAYRTLPLLPEPPGVAVVEDLPPLGSAVPVLVPTPRGGTPRPLPAVGDWVKIKVVGLQLHEGQLCLVAGVCSRIVASSKDAHLDAAWAARLAARDAAVWATRPLTTCPAHAHLPVTTVREVHARRLEGRGGTYRLLARLVGHAPADPRAVCRRAPPGSGGGGGSRGWTFGAALTLEDATGRLTALLLGTPAAQLLGLAPFDPDADAGALTTLRARLARLAFIAPAGVSGGGEGAAWLEVVVSACCSRAAVGAAAEAEALAARLVAERGWDGAGACEGSGGLSDAAGAALASPDSCVFLVHDTLRADAVAGVMTGRM